MTSHRCHSDQWTRQVRYIVRAQRVVLLLSPDPSAALTFTEFRKVLHGWTKPDDVLCVPICALVFERDDIGMMMMMMMMMMMNMFIVISHYYHDYHY